MPKGKRQRGPFMNITTADGLLIERIDLGGYDLSKSLACQSLLADIKRAVGAALAVATGGET